MSRIVWKAFAGLAAAGAAGVARIATRRGAAYLWESSFDEDPTA